jgi:hypothetical protein
MLCRIITGLLLLVAVFPSLRAQTLTIEGIADRTTYNDTASFRVLTNAGFSYRVTLNGVAVSAGVTNRITRMDYYDLSVSRTNDSTSAVTNVLVRFIVLSSRRGSPELGLIEWVPLPPIPSTAGEMAGAQLHLLTPQDYPAGLDIPVVARVEDIAGKERRVNGWVSAPGFELNAFRVLRGHGFGLLPPAAPGSMLAFNGTLQSLQTNKQINIESNTIWTTVSGILGTTTWATNSRIHVTNNLSIPAGATLTIQAGTVVRLDPTVNVSSSGRTVINGTATQPVVFTSANRVAPEQHTAAWGGWLLRGTSAELIANHAIMTGAGAAPDFDFTPATSHRTEQALLLVHSGATVRMTNCALINNAGQIGNGYFSSIVWDHCLLQRAITVGEYEGCPNIISHSALIEFPSVDGVYNASIANADYDGFYTINGTNLIVNSLLGFAKDDAIDSGSGGPGTVVVSNCWIESALHEALAWSGEGRRTWTYDSVLMNCGQGIEAGWSTTNASSPVSPICYASNLLSTANSVGARYGDNYTGTTGLGLKAGFLTVTNSFLLHNYRDVWGQVWDNTWNWRTNQMDIRSNFITAPSAVHPSNTVWNPAADGSRLAAFMSTPPDAPVGIGMATWFPITPASLTNGIPVRLSSFTTNFVTVDYAIETPDATLATGTLTFAPGEMVKNIFGDPSALGAASTWRVALRNPNGGEITGEPAAYAFPTNQVTEITLIAPGTNWKYLDDGSNQGTAWRDIQFPDNTWSNGLAQLGFGDSPRDEATFIRRTNSVTGTTNITFYFRRAFNVSNPSVFADLSMWLLRDDGGVVYLNGMEMVRSPSLPSLPSPITHNTFANNQGSAPPDNSIDIATLSASALVAGTNVVAVEIHQYDLGSSDISFDFALSGLTAQLFATRFGDQLALHWSVTGYALEQADQVTGPWTFVTSQSPATVNLTASQRFFRLRKP